eukprot:GHRQ01014412.1.p1 GENE.GHRQ01014412.1~~GHRQ01014412.1.p1  ORF type:complete len:268 (+),score=64.74 GHRQ01014412.1:932-1735(+)
MGWLSKHLQESGLQDEGTLHRMGYKQELSRQLSMFHNFATTFSFLSPITGLTGTYAYLYRYGGPVSAVWGWCLVVCFNFLVGLVVSEILSAYPTSGGVYYWAHKLAGPRSRGVLSFVCGWFNLLGQLGSSAGVAYTTAWLITDFIRLGSGGAAGAAAGLAVSQAGQLGVYAAVLVVIGLVNTLTVRALGLVGEISSASRLKSAGTVEYSCAALWDSKLVELGLNCSHQCALLRCAVLCCGLAAAAVVLPDCAMYADMQFAVDCCHRR